MVQKTLIVVGKCVCVRVCEMLVRHECCGVGARRSGGGTPCATARDGGALVLLGCVNEGRKHEGGN